jgi:hypothetical protein
MITRGTPMTLETPIDKINTVHSVKSHGKMKNTHCFHMEKFSLNGYRFRGQRACSMYIPLIKNNTIPSSKHIKTIPKPYPWFDSPESPNVW